MISKKTSFRKHKYVSKKNKPYYIDNGIETDENIIDMAEHEKKGFKFSEFIQNIVLLTLGSLIFAGGLSVYNKQSDLTKAIFDSEYKPLSKEIIECEKKNTAYIKSLSEYTGISSIIKENFTLENIEKYQNNIDFQNQFIEMMKLWSTQNKELENKKFATESCRRDIVNGFENILTLLAISPEDTPKGEPIDQVLLEDYNKKTTTVKKLPLNRYLSGLILPDHQPDIVEALSQNNMTIFIEMLTAKLTLENNIYLKENNNFKNKRLFISKIISEKIDRGIIRSLPSILY